MHTSTWLFVVAWISGLWGVVSLILIAAALDRRGVPVNVLFLGPLTFRYVRQYRQLTLKETSRVGPLFYSFVIAINVALVAAVAGLAINAW
jgi:hypothetical protein